MAPIKQEEQMKDRLEKRTLQPSPESWATLANRLDAEQNIKNKSMFWWFGIAASIVGIVFITALYFNNQPIQNTTPTVVDSNEAALPEKKEETINNKAQASHVSIEEVVPTKKYESHSNSNSKVNNKISNIEAIDKSLSEESKVANVEKSPSYEAIESVKAIKQTILKFEDQKIQDVVAQIRKLNAKGQAVSDAEIDSLLKKAQKEILNNKLYNEHTRTVDANALLQDVEADLQQSFRSKVFEALQSGYESVKTAVAERNN